MRYHPATSLFSPSPSVRKFINWLPIADVCQLEETPFINRMDLEAHWKHYDYFSPEFSHHLHEVCKAKWGVSQFAKSVCYSKVASCVLDGNISSLGMRDDDGNIFNILPIGDQLTSLMYGIRSFYPSGENFPFSIDCVYTFPSRYEEYQDWSYTFTFDGLVSAAVDGFGGKLPRMLKLRLDSRSTRLSDTALNLVTGDLECLEILVTTKKKLKDALKIIEKASKLETLAIEYYARANISWMELAKLPLPNLRILVLLNFAMSQDAFHEFVQMFLSMLCSHRQKLILEGVTVNNLSGKTVHKFGRQGNPSSLPFWPELALTNRSYLHLKTVEVVHSMVKTNQLVLSWSKEAG